MTANEFRDRIAALGFTQQGFGVHVGANERTVRRWVSGEQDIPRWVPVMLDLMETVERLAGRPVRVSA